MRPIKSPTTSTGLNTVSDMRLKKVDNKEPHNFCFHQLHSADEKTGMCNMSGEIITTYKSGIGILTGIYHFLHFFLHGKITLTLRRLMSYIYIYIYIYIYMEHPFLMFLDHTQRRSTVGRTPLDE